MQRQTAKLREWDILYIIFFTYTDFPAGTEFVPAVTQTTVAAIHVNTLAIATHPCVAALIVIWKRQSSALLVIVIYTHCNLKIYSSITTLIVIIIWKIFSIQWVQINNHNKHCSMKLITTFILTIPTTRILLSKRYYNSKIVKLLMLSNKIWNKNVLFNTQKLFSSNNIFKTVKKLGFSFKKCH